MRVRGRTLIHWNFGRSLATCLPVIRLSKLSILGALVLLVGILSACEVDTYCRNCKDDGAVVSDGGGPDAGPKQVIATGGGGAIRYCAVRAPGLPGGDGMMAASVSLVGLALAARRFVSKK